jgi:hypothetical protein
VKGHFANDDWINMYVFGEGPKKSSSDFTIIIYRLTLSSSQDGQSYILGGIENSINTNTVDWIPLNSTLDFQVEAMMGYWTRTEQFASQHFVANESGWTATQTVKLPSSSTPSVSPTQAVPYPPSIRVLSSTRIGV